jgi:hypothetical protein
MNGFRRANKSEARPRRRPAAAAGLVAAGALMIGAMPLAHAAVATPAQRGKVAADTMSSPLRVVDRIHGGAFVVGGQRYDMRGFDYQPLVLTKVMGKVRQYANETFVSPFYNHAAVASMLAGWQAQGYNSVRVFLNPNQIGNRAGAGLDAAYVANVADFISTAAQHGVRTLVTIGALPTAGRFAPAPNRDFGNVNADYLNPAFIGAENRYLVDLIDSLKNDHAPLVDVLWELKGEQDWDNRAAPLSWKRGLVHTADGRTYNMAVPAQRVAMENANLVSWTNSLTGTVHRLVPGSLVGVGVYPPSVRRAAWTVRPQLLFTSATANNFVDVHVYPNLGPELTQINSFGAGSTRKPVIMGEFGATRRTAVPAAVKSLLTWQARSCSIGGVSISGWLLWTWNSSVDTEFWDALAGGGQIEHALAPVNRPNPCVG